MHISILYFLLAIADPKPTYDEGAPIYWEGDGWTVYAYPDEDMGVHPLYIRSEFCYIMGYDAEAPHYRSIFPQLS